MAFCGGGSNKAQQQAAQNENAQQQQIDLTDKKINSIYSSPERQQQYTDLARNTTNFYQQELDRQQTNAARNLKFALARGGQLGGSVQADQSGVLGRDYTRGLLSAQQRGLTAADQLRAADQSSKAQLYNEAQSGLDSGTAARMATEALTGNLASAQDNAQVNQLGDMFGNLSDFYSKSQEANNNRRAYQYGFGLYQPLAAQGRPGVGY